MDVPQTTTAQSTTPSTTTDSASTSSTTFSIPQISSVSMSYADIDDLFVYGSGLDGIASAVVDGSNYPVRLFDGYLIVRSVKLKSAEPVAVFYDLLGGNYTWNLFYKGECTFVRTSKFALILAAPVNVTASTLDLNTNLVTFYGAHWSSSPIYFITISEMTCTYVSSSSVQVICNVKDVSSIGGGPAYINMGNAGSFSVPLTFSECHHDTS